MHIFEERGICVKDKSKIFIDACNPGEDLNIVTHAHSDHARFRNGSNCIMTIETRDLIEEKAKKAKVKIIKKNKKFQLNEFEISLHDSGHILGSTQVLIQNGQSLVMTSDLKLQPSLLFKGAEVLKSDILLIESTFGRPEFVFPDREETYQSMSKWIKANLKQDHFVILGGYATGKAQELTKFVNEYTEETPLVYDKIFKQNEVYEKHGVKLGDYVKLQDNFKDGNILILPPHLINQELMEIVMHLSGKKVSTGIATGWKRRGIGCKTFPLSDHGDFKQLMEYVEQASPKMVLTHHGFAKDLAMHIHKKFGITARPVGKKSYQQVLGEFRLGKSK